MRALSTWSGALTGIMLILIGAMVPSAILLPKLDLPLNTLTLNSSWQIPGLLICALVSGPSSAVIASVAYIIIGVFFLPIFQGGGSIGYLLTPEFGYLLGFAPAAYITGHLAQKQKVNNIVRLFLAAVYGVLVIHIIGTINLVIGTSLTNWPETLGDLIFKYTLAPLTAQILICSSVSLVALIMRKLLLVK